ncbi:MAG: HAD family hydrolase [Limisphaerales bacterium]|jgi:HAD superfamily hydrolase (TIGR01484 family)|nr:HAD family hydrolase [Verrucomicrobiota bacterium]
MIRLLCTDFDGTIFHESGDSSPISPRFLNLIRSLKSKGVQWVISTGRDRHEVLATLHHCGVDVLPDFLSTVERELYERKGDEYEPMQPWNQTCHEVHKELYEKIDSLLSPLEESIKKNYSDSVLYSDAYSPLCFIAANNPQADQLLDEVEQHFADVPELTLVRNDVYARLAHIDYNKGTTLLELQRHLGLTPDRVCTAGDHYNDIPMLRREVAHFIVTPSNAIEPIKDQVLAEGGYVSPLFSGEGIAEGVEKFLANHS